MLKPGVLEEHLHRSCAFGSGNDDKSFHLHQWYKEEAGKSIPQLTPPPGSTLLN
jgi:hypothetical protein